MLAAAPTTEMRDQEEAGDIRYGQTPSDIPTGGLINEIRPTTLAPFEGANVAAHGDKHVYIGYGVYDPEQEHCALADVGSLDGSDAIDSGRFEEASLQIFNGHSYLMSVNSMNYATCRDWAMNYYGYPAIVTSASENDFLTEAYGTTPYWLGIYKPFAASPYRDAKGESATYFNFSTEDASWAENRSNVIKTGDSWFKVSATDSRKCVIEIESEDYKRPVKICAPWWSIERTYKRPPESRYLVESVDAQGNPTTVDIRTFNQSDYPQRVKVCTEREVLPAGVNPDDTVNVTCNSYYDVTKSPLCQENPQQELCFVNECRGSIINSCTLVDTEDAPKGYGKKMVVDENGQETYIKAQVDVKMHKYECSAFTTSAACLNYADVTMLPQPCPGTHSDPNDETSKPIRVYGSAQRAVYAADGTLEKLQGKCPDGTLVDVPVDVLSRNTRVCTRYDWIEQHRTWSERCVTERPYRDITVSTALTEHDAYEDDPDCVRLNNIVDAQPDRETVIRYLQKGYADMNLKKAYIEGTATPDWTVPIGTGYIEHVLSNMNWSGDSDSGDLGDAAALNLTPAQEAELAELDIDCDALSNAHKVFLEGNLAQYQYGLAMQEVGLGTSLDLIGRYSGSNPRLHVARNVTWAQCAELKSRIDAFAWTTAGGLVPNAWSAIITTKEFATPDSRDWASLPLADIAAAQSYLNNTYRFNDAGISVSDLITPETDVWETGTCPILIESDNLVQLGDTSVSGSTVTTQLRIENTFNSCLKVAYCSSGNLLNPMPYSGTQICRLRYDGNSNAADFVNDRIADKLDDFAAENAAATETPTEVRAHDEDGSWRSIPENPLSIDGTNEIFFIQEFSPPLRGWGYLPSYNFKKYDSSYVTANGRYIWPIVPLPSMTEPIDFEWRNWRKTRTFRGSSSPFVAANAFIGETGGFKDRPESYAYSFLTGGTGFLLSSVVAIFSGTKKEFEADVSVKIYSDQADYRDYVPNFYPLYEGRVEEGARFRYSQLSYATSSPLRNSDEHRFYDAVNTIIDDFADTLNIYDPNSNPFHSAYSLTNLTGIRIGWPGLDWWNPWDVKTRTSNAAQTSGTVEMRREVTTHYMGAVNGVGIVVPYAGDYEVRAYDSLGSEVSYVDVPESSFVSITGYGQERAARVMLGLNMNTVVGSPCSDSGVAVVGGGTVGGYYELRSSDPQFSSCGQADHTYVEEHAIKQLHIKVKNTDKYYVIDLDYPMPWANRAFLITYNYKQDKIYRCFDGDFGECPAYEVVK